MKGKKLLTAMGVYMALLTVASLVVSIVIFPKIWLFEKDATDPNGKPSQALLPTDIAGTDADKLNGFANVTLYGAVPDDGKDDTAAFQKAIGSNASLYIPKGVYEISDTLVLTGQNIKGSGPTLTVIKGTASKSLFKLSGRVLVEGVGLCYDDKALTQKETAGQATAFHLEALLSSSVIKNVHISNVGTGFYSPADKEGAAFTTIEGVKISDFTYSAVDFAKTTGTYFRAVEVENKAYKPESALRLGGSFTIESITVNDMECAYPITLTNAYSAVAKAITFLNVTATQKAFIQSANSTLVCQSLSAVSSPADYWVSGTGSKGRIVSAFSDSGVIKGDSEGKITVS